jgi:hypothetical protein
MQLLYLAFANQKKLGMMKILKYFFLLLVIPLNAQPGLWKSGDTLDKTGQFVELPDMPKGSVFDVAPVLFTTDSAYRKYFGDSAQRLPAIDFSRYEVIGSAKCMRCAALCPDHPGCHRDACRYSRYWIRAEKTNRTVIQPKALEGCSMSKMNMGVTIITSDSMLRRSGIKCPAVDFTRSVLLTYETISDCKARFRHEFYLDPVHKWLVWRVFEEKGDCAGMMRHAFYFETARLPEHYQVVKEIYREHVFGH